MQDFWQSIKDFFVDNGWKIAGVVILVVLGAIAIKIICRVLRRVFNRRNVDSIVSSFVTTIVNIVLVIVLVIAVFGMMGISTAPFVAILGTVGLALALSLQDSLANVAGGIILIATKPFKQDDFVDISGTSGSVVSMHIFTTRLLTPDNKTVVLPNSAVSKGTITNYTSMDTRRVDLTFNVAYGSTVAKVKSVILNTAEAQDLILQEPAPFVGVTQQAESALVFIAKLWVKTADYWTVYYDMQEKVYEAFLAEGIEIPYNKLDVNLLKN